jgi:integrase
MDAMPRPNRPGLIHERNRHGTWRWIYRPHKRAKRIALMAPYGTAEFWQQYESAVAGRLHPAKPENPHTAKRDTLKWLVEHWQQSSDWRGSAEATQRQRINILAHVLEANGDRPHQAITRKHIIEGRERRQETPFAANNFLKTMRALFKWAKSGGLRDDNPAEGVPFLGARTPGFEPWTAADVVAYRARWGIGTRARVALELIYATGLRRGDVVALGRQHLGARGHFEIRTEKTGETVFPPMTAALAEAVTAGPCGVMVYVATAKGTPMTKESFGNSFNEWCRAAGIRKSAHGLRKLVVTEAVEAGCSEAELQDMFGWTTIRQSAVYTRTRSRRSMAGKGWDKRNGNTRSANLAEGAAETQKRGLK